jgi:hypothetical protein
MTLKMSFLQECGEGRIKESDGGAEFIYDVL